MSNDLQKQLHALWTYVLRGGLAFIVGMLLLIFNDIRVSISVLGGDVKEIRKDMQGIREMVIEHGRDLDNAKRDIDRLDRTKADRR